MNKFVATCLESQLCLFEARTQHPTHGFAMAASTVTRTMAGGEGGNGGEDGGGGGQRDATLWSAQHLPQNRDVFLVSAGDGSLSLHKYHYPDERCGGAVWGVCAGGKSGDRGGEEEGDCCQAVAAWRWLASM